MAWPARPWMWHRKLRPQLTVAHLPSHPPRLQSPSTCSCSSSSPRRTVQRQRHMGRRVLTAAAGAQAASEEVQIRKTRVSETVRVLDVTIPAAACQAAFHTCVDEAKRAIAEHKGLTRESVPLSLVVAECGGQRQFKIRIIEEAMAATMPTAMQMAGEALVAGSERVASNVNELEAGFDPSQPLTVQLEYEVLPPVQWKRHYKEARVTIRDTGNFDTDREAVEGLIRQRLKQHGRQRVVTGRGLRPGDTCLMDIEVRARGSKAVLPGMKKSKLPFDSEVDPLGLAEGMAGMLPGEKRSFAVRMPDDYSVELWRGMEADAKVQVHQLFEWVLPEFNDAFVKTAMPGAYPSADAMRAALLKDTVLERTKELDRRLEGEMMELIVSCLDVPEVPESLVIEMGATHYQQHVASMARQNLVTEEGLAELSKEDMFEEYIDTNKKQLQDMVRFGLAVEHIFHAEGLSLAEEEVDQAIEGQARLYEARSIDYDPELLRERVLDSLRSFHVMEWLKDHIDREVLAFDAAPGQEDVEGAEGKTEDQGEKAEG